jgi:hypothetical protein
METPGGKTGDQGARTRLAATSQDVALLQSRGEKIDTVEAAQAFVDGLGALAYVDYLRGKIEGAPKTPGAGAYEPRAGVETVEIFLNHPIHYSNFKFSRGLHTVEAELAALFLTFKDPISRAPIAEIPKPAGPVRGTVTK